jgi:arylsulfatase A-like enzyme
MRRMLSIILIAASTAIIVIFYLTNFFSRYAYQREYLQPDVVMVEKNVIDFADRSFKHDLIGNIKITKDGVKFTCPGIAYRFYLAEQQNLWAFISIFNRSNSTAKLTIWLNRNLIELIELKMGLNNFKLLLPISFQQKGINFLYFITDAENAKIVLNKIEFNNHPIQPQTAKVMLEPKGSMVWLDGRGEVVYYLEYPKDGFIEYKFKKVCRHNENAQNNSILVKIKSDDLEVQMKHSIGLSKNKVIFKRFSLINDDFKRKKVMMRIKVESNDRWENCTIGINVSKKDRVETSKIVSKTGRCRNCNVLIIVLDAASASHFKLYGYNKETTPQIEKLARNSYVFDNAYSVAAFTRGSTASLFTSLYPDVHEVMSFQFTLSEHATTLSEIFKLNNYITALFTSNGNVSIETGLHQGFDKYYPMFRSLPDEFTNKIINFIDNNKKQNFFIYAHYRHPHPPYDAPFEIRDKFNDTSLPTLPQNNEFIDKVYNEDIIADDEITRYVISQYDANLYYVDFYVGKLISYLEKNKLDKNTIIIITADHGEAFNTHEVFGHIWDLHFKTIWIPLIVYIPNSSFQKHIKALVDTTDIMPSIIDLLSLKNNSNIMQGNSFYRCLYSEHCETKKFAYSQSVIMKISSLVDENYQVIYDVNNKTWELYDIVNDKDERFNLINQIPISSEYYRHKLFLIKKNNAKLRKTMQKLFIEGGFKPSKEVIDNLKSLGYIK